MKRKVEAFAYAKEILEAVNKGVLMTTCADGEVDTMTISWGTMGIQWGKPIFIAFVRESRHTKTLVDKNPEFTVNVPLNGCDKNILAYCGTKSGRDVNKIRELGLTLEDGETVCVPAIKELPLTLECKVIYKQEQDRDALAPFAMERYYKEGDFHTAYYGEITNAYIVE